MQTTPTLLPAASLTRWFLGFLPGAATADPAVERVLAEHALHRELQPRGLTVRCTCGCLWLTQDGQAQDIVLEAGQQHTCTSGSRLLVYALEASAFRTFHN